MKSTIIFVLFISILLTGCGNSSAVTSDVGVLTVGDGSNQKTYTVEDLKALPPSEAVFNQVNYVGVSLPYLLKDAGIDTHDLTAVKAIASDGYSVYYEPKLFLREDVVVVYAEVDEHLAEDDGLFRMVLPGEEGKLSVRKLIQIEAVP